MCEKQTCIKIEVWNRFNEADKWFACGTFENAMQSEQARIKHFSPASEVTFEVRQASVASRFEDDTTETDSHCTSHSAFMPQAWIQRQYWM